MFNDSLKINQKAGNFIISHFDLFVVNQQPLTHAKRCSFDFKLLDNDDLISMLCVLQQMFIIESV